VEAYNRLHSDNPNSIHVEYAPDSLDLVQVPSQTKPYSEPQRHVGYGSSEQVKYNIAPKSFIPSFCITLIY